MPTADAFEWPEGVPLFETTWRALSEGLTGNGILSAGDFQVTATANALEIQVAAGTAIYDGSRTTLGSASTFTLTSGDGSNDRWDTVFFDTGTGSAGVREGSANSSPEPPDISGDEILLAVILVEQNASDVTDADIHNWRSTPDPQPPGTTTSASPGFGTWTTADSDLPVTLEVEVAPQTDGTSDGVITLEVDESGGTTADYSFTARAPSAFASGTALEGYFSVYLPAGGAYRIANTADPNTGNAINTVREVVV